MNLTLYATILLGLASPCLAQAPSKPMPVELQVIRDWTGVWDAEFEVWPQGPDSDSIKFKGVETNRPFGEYWIASDLQSEYMGQSNIVHSIVGYDLDEKRMVGKVIDQGPYAATLTGDYDKESKTVHWTTNVKDPSGKPIVQKTSVTQKSADERVLVLSVPKPGGNDFTKFMQIRFLKRK